MFRFPLCFKQGLEFKKFHFQYLIRFKKFRFQLCFISCSFCHPQLTKKFTKSGKNFQFKQNPNLIRQQKVNSLITRNRFKNLLPCRVLSLDLNKKARMHLFRNENIQILQMLPSRRKWKIEKFSSYEHFKTSMRKRVEYFDK